SNLRDIPCASRLRSLSEDVTFVTCAGTKMKQVGVRAPLFSPATESTLMPKKFKLGYEDEERVVRRTKAIRRGRANFQFHPILDQRTNIPFLIYSKSIAFRWTRGQKSLEFFPSLGSGFWLQLILAAP